MYVDNKSLTKSLSEWSRACRKSKRDGNPNPPLPDVIAECALLIAKRLTSKDNFLRYTYLEDLISQAVLCVVKYAHNFNPARTNNGFAYLTTILHNAIIAGISKEKEHAYLKAKLIKDSGIIHSLNNELRDSNLEIIQEFEKRRAKKKEPKC